MITSGQGRLTGRLLIRAQEQGYPIKLSDGVLDSARLQQIQDLYVQNLPHDEFLKRLSQIVHITDAEIMQQIIAREADQSGRKIPDGAIVVEKDSKNTKQNFQNCIPLLAEIKTNLGYSASHPLRVVVMHEPYLEYRAMAHCYAFNEAWKKININWFSYTLGLEQCSMPIDDLARMLLREIGRIVIYTAKRDLVPHYRGVLGLDAIPRCYWQAVKQLTQDERFADISQRLFRLTQDAQDEIVGLLGWEDLLRKLREVVGEKALAPELMDFIDWIYAPTAQTVKHKLQTSSTRMIKSVRNMPQDAFYLGEYRRYLTHLDGEIPGPLNRLKWALPWPVDMQKVGLLMNFHKREYIRTLKPEMHFGIDIFTHPGTPVTAISTGSVELIQCEPFSINRFGLVIRSDNGFVVKYRHMEHFSATFARGQKINSGDNLGYVANWPDGFCGYRWQEDHFTHDGSWARCKADHLHMQVYYHPKRPATLEGIGLLYDPWHGESGFNPLLVLQPLYPYPKTGLQTSSTRISRTNRFNGQGFVNKAIIPDGKGGWKEISLGQEYKRIVSLASSGRVTSGALLRAIKERGTDIRAQLTVANNGDSSSKVILANIGTVNYGIRTLAECLSSRNITVDTVNIIDTSCLSQFASTLRASKVPAPNIIGISVFESTIEDVISLIKIIRKDFPEAFVLIGGPETQHTEQLAVILNDFDIIIKGQADEAIIDAEQDLKLNQATGT